MITEIITIGKKNVGVVPFIQTTTSNNANPIHFK